MFLLKYLLTSFLSVGFIYELLKRLHIQIQTLYLIFAVITFPIFLYYFLGEIEKFPIRIKELKLMEEAQKKAEQIIRQAQNTAQDIESRAQRKKTSIETAAALLEKKIKQEKNEYYAFQLNANQTIEEITDLINDLYIKNQQLLSGIQSLLQRLGNALQKAKNREKALNKFEKLKTETIELVRKNVIDKTLSDAIIKKLLENTTSNVKNTTSNEPTSTIEIEQRINAKVQKLMEKNPFGP